MAGDKKAQKKAQARAKKFEAKGKPPAGAASAEHAWRSAYSQPKTTSAPKALKRGKIGAIVGGAGLLGLATGNEIHRRKGGKPFKGHFDKYKP